MSHIIIRCIDTDEGVSINSEVCIECQDDAAIMVVELQKLNLRLVQKLLDESTAWETEGETDALYNQTH